jgi:hypothetical protein
MTVCNACTTILAQRRHVPDASLIDAAELAALAPDLPWRVSRAVLQEHWRITQSALHRRLRRLQRWGLIEFETEHGTVLITGIKPCLQQCDNS